VKVAPLEIEVSPRNVGALRAAWSLRSNPCLNVSLRSIDTPQELPRGRVLRIESGSRVEPMLTLLYGAERQVDDDEHQRAALLGLNAAVFTAGRPGYEWSGRGRPLPARACVGVPDPRRPWVLVAPGVRVDERALERLAALDNPQLHFLGPAAYSRKFSAVWWLPSPRVVLSLLGRVGSVLAPPGPLAWDAERLGVPVIDAGSAPWVSARVVERRLAHVVPAALVSEPGFWKSLGSQLAQPDVADAWGTAAWLLRAREGRLRPPAGLFSAAHLKRKLLKLQRDPSRFWADSPLIANWLETTRSKRASELTPKRPPTDDS
jgi:hypothetical protein